MPVYSTTGESLKEWTFFVAFFVAVALIFCAGEYCNPIVLAHIFVHCFLHYTVSLRNIFHFYREKPSWADLVEEAGENGTPTSKNHISLLTFLYNIWFITHARNGRWPYDVTTLVLVGYYYACALLSCQSYNKSVQMDSIFNQYVL